MKRSLLVKIIKSLNEYILHYGRFRSPRLWSNKELRKYSNLFKGHVVNVSAWDDRDKEGGTYFKYFKNAKSYTLTNYETEMRGMTGAEGEIYLDLESELDKELINKFDVVFNHTTLEHIYGVKKAMQNLALLTKDILITVVPYKQIEHTTYGDYWRFTPSGIKKLYEENNIDVIYQKFNRSIFSSKYLFTIGSKNKKDGANSFYKLIHVKNYSLFIKSQ